MTRIDVKGFIITQEDKWIYDWLEYPYTCAEDVNQALADAKGDDIEVYINSYGGAVNVGSEIYTALKDYKGNVLIKIVGLAASAASVIGMSGKSVMSPTAQIMMHNASTGARGDYRIMDQTSKMLQVTNKSILNAYKLKSGLSEEEIKAIMDKETWLTAQEAKELGLVDEIMFENEQEDATNTAPVLYNSLPMPGFKAIEEMRMCGNIDKFKESIAQKQIQSRENVFNVSKKEEGKTMDLKTFQAEHKEIYDQVVENTIKAERERIKAIEDLAMPGFENLVNKAKFENGISAEALAMEIVKASKEKGNSYLAQANEDAKVIDEVEGEVPNEETKNQEKTETVNKLVNYINRRRGK